jgi:hypothetical protein
VSVRRKPSNATTIFEDEAKTMKTKELTIYPPARVMPTGSDKGVLGGNQINGS